MLIVLSRIQAIEARDKRTEVFIGDNGEEKKSGHRAASVIFDSCDQAWQRPIGRTVPRDKLAALLEVVFSNEKIADTLDRLQEEHAQTLVDVIDTVRRRAPQSPDDVPGVYFDSMLSFG